MNSEIKMSVSSMTRHGDDKAIYIMFTDGSKYAEYTLPDCKLISNKDFSDEEIKMLMDYVSNEREAIMSIAKEVNPMKGFLGQPQAKNAIYKLQESKK